MFKKKSINYSHMYESGQYTDTAIFKSRRTEAWGKETEEWNNKHDVDQLALSIENKIKEIMPNTELFIAD